MDLGAQFFDEDGLGLKIRKTGDATHEMTDDSVNLWQFKDGLLVMALIITGRVRTGKRHKHINHSEE